MKKGSSVEELRERKRKLQSQLDSGGHADGLRLDPENANRGTERGRQMVQDSIEELGAGRSVLATSDGVVIAGNKTIQAARKARIPVRTVKTRGDELVVVVREDLKYGDERATRLAIADNRAAEVGLDWDPRVVGNAAAAVDLTKLFTADELSEVAGMVERQERELLGRARKLSEEEREGSYSEQGSVLPGDLQDDAPVKDPRVRRTTTADADDLDLDNPENEPGEDQEDKIDEGIYALREEAKFPSDNPWGIPELRLDMLADEDCVPTRTWSATGEEQGERGLDKTLVVYGTNRLPERCDGAVLGFYVEDWRFEAVWNDAVETMEKIRGKGFAGVIAPDFSIWRDDPMAVQLFNVYRARWCARYWQEVGIKIIPSLNWSGPESYDWAFAGLPVGAPVCSVQCRTTTSRRGKAYFLQGLVAAINKAETGIVLMYGGATHRDWIEPHLPKKVKGKTVRYVWLVDFITARKRRLKEIKQEKAKARQLTGDRA